MKKYAISLLLCFLLAGCGEQNTELNDALELRTKLLQGSGCSFTAQVTAQYGDALYSFAMDCTADRSNCLLFTVTQPESIAGITGKLTSDTGELTFDDTALQFPLEADQQLSPVSAPWILLKALRSGYIASVCREEGQLRLSLDDSYREDTLRLDIWLDTDHLPEQADILQNGRRILSVTVKDFVIL